MLEQIIIYLFLGTMLGGMLANMVRVVTSNSRNLSVIKNRPKRVRAQPIISVLVYAQNDASLIERCLKSIVKSSYRKHEIIVVDNGSKDNTKQVVKNFKAKHSKKTIRLLSKRRASRKGSALNAGFTAHAKGQLIVVLEASSILDKQALRNTAQYFMQDEQLSAMTTEVRSLPHPSIIALLQQFNYISRPRPNKQLHKTLIEGGTAVAYRRNIFGKLKHFNQSKWNDEVAFDLSSELPKENIKLKHANNVLVYIEPLTKYGSLISRLYHWELGRWQMILLSSRRRWLGLLIMIVRQIVIVAAPFILTYFIYLALTVHYSLLLTLSWVAVTVYLYFLVWSDSHTTFQQRLRLSLLIPIMFTVYYIATFIQALILLRCMSNLKQAPKTRAKKPIKRSSKRPALRSRTAS